MNKFKKFRNISLSVIIFLFLIGSSFAVSFLFGLLFTIGFFIAVYKKEIIKKPWKPISIFFGALIIRFSLGLFPEFFTSETVLDLIIIFLIFLTFFLLGWKIKRR